MEVYLYVQESYLYLYRELTLFCGEVTLTFNRKVTVTCMLGVYPFFYREIPLVTRENPYLYNGVTVICTGI